MTSDPGKPFPRVPGDIGDIPDSGATSIFGFDSTDAAPENPSTGAPIGNGGITDGGAT